MIKKNATDPFSNYAAKVVEQHNIYLAIGFMFVAIALISLFIDASKVAGGAGLVGLVICYYGLVLSVFAERNRTLRQKIGTVIAIPFAIALGVLLYLQ